MRTAQEVPARLARLWYRPLPYTIALCSLLFVTLYMVKAGTALYAATLQQAGPATYTIMKDSKNQNTILEIGRAHV